MDGQTSARATDGGADAVGRPQRFRKPGHDKVRVINPASESGTVVALGHRGLRDTSAGQGWPNAAEHRRCGSGPHRVGRSEFDSNGPSVGNEGFRTRARQDHRADLSGKAYCDSSALQRDPSVRNGGAKGVERNWLSDEEFADRRSDLNYNFSAVRFEHIQFIVVTKLCWIFQSINVQYTI